MKHALQYNLDFESPLIHVQRFFANTFSVKQMRTNPALAQWRTETEQIIQNTSFIPLSLQFHPVLIAAAYLSWSRQHILQNSILSGLKPLNLPETLHGHPWFLFLDPGISACDLEQLVLVVDGEIKYLA